jgi:TetR/AcrR family transcriptional regulator
MDISHNLIPQRFGSKKRLWYAAVDEGFGEINAAHPCLLKIINQEASQPGPRLDYLFDNFIKPVRDFGQAWLTRLADQGRIKPTSISLFYFMMTQGAGGSFAMPALAARLASDEDVAANLSIEAQAEMAVGILFDGLLVR